MEVLDKNISNKTQLEKYPQNYNCKGIEESEDDFTKKRIKRLKRVKDIIKAKMSKIGTSLKNDEKCSFWIEPLSFTQSIKPILNFLTLQ